MELKYIRSESYSKPPEVERGKTTAYFRKNFVEEDRNGVSVWTFEEATIPVGDFDKYAAGIAAENAVKGVNANDNQLIIMEAIADLYDLIASMSGGTNQ